MLISPIRHADIRLLLLQRRFIPGLCEVTRGRSWTLMPLILLKLGTNAIASANRGWTLANKCSWTFKKCGESM